MPNLNNTNPVDPLNAAELSWTEKLQGNILNGHGRDFTANVFFALPSNTGTAQALLKRIAQGVTSAAKQEHERRRFKKFRVPGDTFKSVLISANGYRRLGFSDAALAAAFTDSAGVAPPVNTTFVAGAVAAISELSDPALAEWEEPYTKQIDALLIIGDDSELGVDRIAAVAADQIEAGGGKIVHIERGKALRSPEGEGIEHFGYVDGRSQPLYTTFDFKLKDDGSLDTFLDGHLRESNGGRTDAFDPFAPLRLVLVKDNLTADADAFGSYFVFRKLEQNVRGFKFTEQALADALELEGQDRERAGAMVVGRFEDGTPVVASQTDGFLPAKENNFSYAGDTEGKKCPFHAHIRKTNPRGETGAADEADRRITRRGITFGDRGTDPQAFQAIDELPSSGVGLLFMCFQSSIPKQFGFMQKFWANNEDFLKAGTGIDPIIGQKTNFASQSWRSRWGEDDPGLGAQPNKSLAMGDFVRMKGGEFFFCPSIPFLNNPSP